VQRGQGISFVQDEHCFIADKFSANSNGAFYCYWFGNKPVMRTTTSNVSATFFDPGSPESAAKRGEGLITPGNMNSRGQIHNFDLNFRSFNGSTLIHTGYAYLCPTNKITMAGTFGGDVMKLVLEEKPMEGDNAKDEVHHYKGTFEFNSRKGIIQASSRFISGQGEILNPITNAVDGNISMVWLPSQNCVLKMLDSEDYKTDNLRIFIYLRNKSFPNGAFRDLRRSKN
jgi:hypothetical protein